MSLKIVADENMPLVEECFEGWGEIVRLPGRTIGPSDVRDADILLVRSVTDVNAGLLEGSRVRFVATATIGVDHLDAAWLDRAGVHWASAPGCNADAVAEYVVCCVAQSLKSGALLKWPLRAGVVGVGNVGKRVEKRLRALGVDVVLNDPPRREREPEIEHVPLDDFEELDLICLHAPLVKEGRHPTLHLIRGEFLKRQKTGALLLSAGRGEVVDFAHLLRDGGHLKWALDVWEPEPQVDLNALRKARVATPHVAGYSVQAKWRGTQMVYEAAARFFDRPIHPIDPPMHAPVMRFDGAELDWMDVVLSLYDPLDDTRRMKESLDTDDPVERGKRFDRLRKDYRMRHEFNFPILDGLRLHAKDLEVLQALGFRFAP